MKTKILTCIIIGLCLISIIIGLINTITNPYKAHTYSNKEDSGFLSFSDNNDKLALINLEGEISSESSGGMIGETGSAESVLKSLRKAYKDTSVRGILLTIDSPGGTVAMSQEIYETILRIREKKPVVVSMSDLAASGGYYISSAADRIFAEPGTLTGSVGVIMSSFDVHDLMSQKLGIKANVIKSGKFKDIASPYRPLSSDDKNLLQNIIDSTYKQFVGAITKGRVNRNDSYKVKETVLTLENLKKYADGRILTGEQAQKLGFVDQLGGIYESQEALNNMAHCKFRLFQKELPLVRYNVSTGLESIFLGCYNSFISQKILSGSNFVPLSARYSHQPLFVWE